MGLSDGRRAILQMSAKSAIDFPGVDNFNLAQYPIGTTDVSGLPGQNEAESEWEPVRP